MSDKNFNFFFQRKHLSNRDSLNLTVDDFWSLIEKSQSECNGSWERQEQLLIKELSHLTIDEIYCFSEYFIYFKNNMKKKSLVNRLETELGLSLFGDILEYRIGHIVMLGRKAYELALYKEYEFIRTLHTRYYKKNPEAIKLEYYGLAGSAFQLKTGLDPRFLEEQVDKDLKLKLAYILRELKEYEKSRFDQLTTFVVNEYITLKLEDEETVIYVDGRSFMQCNFLLLNIPLKDQTDFDEIDSIDEAEGYLDHSMNGVDARYSSIPPDTLFWGHCSNFQAWAENNYDTRLLHRNLAFPLLKRLVNVGDSKARKSLAEEIAKRLESGYLPVIQFLAIEGYFDYLALDYINLLERKTDFLSQFASEHKLLYMPYFIKIIASYREMVNKEDVDFSHNSLTINDFLEALKEAYLFYNKYREPIEEEGYLNFEISILCIIYRGIGEQNFDFPSNIAQKLRSLLKDAPSIKNNQIFRETFLNPITSTVKKY